jgi:predicted dehydrogenase
MVVASAASGSHAWHAAKKFGFRSCTTDDNEITNNPAVDAVVIATRHHLHAAQVIAALSCGKHVFCEKPLCLSEEELRTIAAAYNRSASTQPILMVGFNRRFAPMAIRMKSFMQQAGEPLALHYRVNAGSLPADHWLNDPLQGGGRILGEVCHFVDFLSFMTGSTAVEVESRSLPGARYSNDNVVCSLRYGDGSHGTITYVANGDKSFSKERIEVFGGGRVAVLEDFRRLELIHGGKKHIIRSLLRQDKGHRCELEAFVAAIQNGLQSPTPFREVMSTMLTTFSLEESRCIGRPVSVKDLFTTDGATDNDAFDRAG